MIRKKLKDLRKETAQGMVEFALILPVLLMVLLGIMESGRLLFFYSSVTTASREGARYGSAVGIANDVSRYQDCNGIRDAALSAGVFANLQNDNVVIQYDDGNNVKDVSCPPSSPIALADRIVVTANGNFKPVVPFLDIFFPDDGLDITSTTARTIIKEVSVKGTPLPDTISCFLLNITHNGNGSYPIASPISSDGCTSDYYKEGETITLSGATPDYGWQIDSWNGTEDDGSTNPENQVIMPGHNHVAGVVYTEIPCYQLTLNHYGQGDDPIASPEKTDFCDDTGWYSEGTEIELSGAAPDTGWQINGWAGTVEDSSTEPTNKVTMPASNHEASVIYNEIPCYPLDLSHTGSGSDPTASPAKSEGCLVSGWYIAGDTITLVAEPDKDWRIKSWNGTTNDESISDTNTVTMPDEAHSARVNYTPNCYSLNLGHTGEGSNPLASPDHSEGCGSGKYIVGEKIDLYHAVPAEGYEVDYWNGTNNDGSSANTNEVTMPSGDHKVIVAYKKSLICPSAGNITAESKKLIFPIIDHNDEDYVLTISSIQLIWLAIEPNLSMITFSDHTVSLSPSAPPPEYTSYASWSGTIGDQEEMILTFQNNISPGQPYQITVQFEGCPAVIGNYP